VKKIIAFLMIACLCDLFGKINDNLELFTKEAAGRIEERILQIEKERKVKIYVNSLPSGEGFSVTDPEKVIVLNIVKENDDVAVNESNDWSVNLNISRDLPVEEYQSDIDLLLNNTQGLLETKSFEHYVLEILDGLDTQLEKVLIDLEEEQDEYSASEKRTEELVTPISEKESRFPFRLDFSLIIPIALILLGISFLGLLVLMIWHRIQGDADFTIHPPAGGKKRKRF